MATDLNPYVTAAYRITRGVPPDPNYTDAVTAFADDPELLAAARDEVARLSAKTGRRVLADHDHESKVRHDTLVKLLADFDARESV